MTTVQRCEIIAVNARRHYKGPLISAVRERGEGFPIDDSDYHSEPKVPDDCDSGESSEYGGGVIHTSRSDRNRGRHAEQDDRESDPDNGPPQEGVGKGCTILLGQVWLPDRECGWRKLLLYCSLTHLSSQNIITIIWITFSIVLFTKLAQGEWCILYQRPLAEDRAQDGKAI
jgi:hypothetical protein